MSSASKFKVNPTPPKGWKHTFYASFVLRSWWVYLCLGTGFLLYSHAIHKKEVAFSDLEKKLATLQMERERVLEQKEDLILQINSQSDPEWIQMMLMKGLGVVPEGQTKVYFEKGE